MDYVQIYLNIMESYNDKYYFCLYPTKVPFCRLKEKTIYIPSSDFLNPDVRIIFDLLHEIGHLETNTKGMKRFEEEYYATEWAIAESKKIGINLSDKDKNSFQNYIWKWMDTARKLKAKNIPDNSCFILKW